jgi:hypothetical protein
MEPQHREAEVLAHRPVHPTGAQHPGARQGQGSCLARRLGGPVDPQGIKRLVRLVGPALLAVEHEIRTHLQQPAAHFGQGLSKGAGGAGIHGMGQLRLAFGLVHRRVGAGIQHPIGLMITNRRMASRGIGQIQLGPAAGDELHLRRR